VRIPVGDDRDSRCTIFRSAFATWLLHPVSCFFAYRLPLAFLLQKSHIDAFPQTPVLANETYDDR
jgi:hypothetical protein